VKLKLLKKSCADKFNEMKIKENIENIEKLVKAFETSLISHSFHILQGSFLSFLIL